MAMLRFVCFVCLLLFGCSSSVRADDAGCYTSGSVAGIVIATVVVTLVMGGLAAAFIWYLWKQRKLGYGDNKSMEKPIVCPPMSPEKQMIARESNDYAFDNPYFKDDETDTTSPDAAEKGESGFRGDNGSMAPTQNAKASNGTTGNHHQPHKKSRPFSSLPFHAVFHPSGKKTQKGTMDDIYISKHLERITVPLRGHDFTGLGFNVCGNMRDGIFVKDVLHRGPASESGKIKAGDRIVSVTVSFSAMVYEDALTILSYASPYDVRLEIEKAPVGALSGGPHLPPSSPKRLGTSTSFRSNGQRQLLHPLYRSQSIDDLTQIGKDGFGVVNTSGSQRDSTSSATPKRSQSVEASNGGLKTRAPFVHNKSEESKSSSSKGSRKSSTSSCESTAKAVTPTEKSQPDVFLEEAPCIKKDTKSARFRVEQTHVKSETTDRVVPPTKPARDLPDDSKQQPENDIPDKPVEITTAKLSTETVVAESPNPDTPQSDIGSNGTPEAAASTDLDVEKPTAPPRKMNTPKRRAPAPPPIQSNSKTEETSAIVHRVDDLPQEQKVIEQEISTQEANWTEMPPPPPISELPPVADEILLLTNESYAKTDDLLTSVKKLKELHLLSSDDKMQPDPGMGSSDNSSLASADHSTSKIDKDEQNVSPGKRKASSLGDLTKLENGTNKKTSTSSAILERAVSLDFQQSLPGENLIKQKKILRAPTFEDNYEEDREDLSEMNGPGLKRWDNGFDEVFAKLPNGDADLNSHLKNGADENHESSEQDVKTEDVKMDINQMDSIDKLDTELVTESTTEKPATDLENDSPIGELPLPNADDPTTVLTSTPLKKVIEVKNLLKDDSDDDVPYLASVKQVIREETYTKNPSKTTNSGSVALFSPVTISIPVIKPDLTHYEKLPSPPPASTHPSLDPGWRMTKTVTSDDSGKTSLERISVQSLYRPIFTSKEINSGDDPVLENNNSLERMVNGNESDASEHYSTAQENTSTSSIETSTLSVTVSSPVTKEVTTIKAPSTIAGFAKTLIIPGPNEVENLLSLAAEPNTPPPLLEPPAKPVEKE